MLKKDQFIAAAYSGLMALKGLLHFGQEPSAGPLATLTLLASILGLVVGLSVVLLLSLGQSKLAAFAFFLLGAGHIAYALTFGVLFEGQLWGYTTAVISFLVGLGFLAFAKGVTDDAQQVIQAGPP